MNKRIVTYVSLVVLGCCTTISDHTNRLRNIAEKIVAPSVRISDDIPLVTTIEDTVLPPSVKIANWNLQIFGRKKAADEQLMQIYADIIDDYDIIFIQEIRDKSGTAFQTLCGMIEGYDSLVSSRAGSTNSKEQYGIIFKDGINTEIVFDYNFGEKGYWERPPICVKFDINGYDLLAYNIHTKPNDVQEELSNLEAIVSNDKGNVIIIGDLNADCRYYDPVQETEFDDWNWIVKDKDDTTVSATDCAYDRIILNDDAFEEFLDYGIHTEAITKTVSDHYLVWVEIVAQEK